MMTPVLPKQYEMRAVIASMTEHLSSRSVMDMNGKEL